ncbi:Pr6Pr family membrane protein [Streptomyces sp. NEAU-sy36]|uniref:Pr6Pr family membrane protein n=1 Tax=unclassified Streptomyces TaxID=2593676 RepID=UPI0015D62A6C|nr:MULTISPECIES: Pr6Pr family membrane protein [unclassified Streptomyces]QLJ05763.1 Pr6Pr family membrane protein [Streptomyces sp. NEAU-sy36]
MTAPIPREIPDLPAVRATTPPLLRPPVPATAVLAPSHRPRVAVFRLLTALTAAAGVTLATLRSTPLHALSHFAVQANVLLAVTMFVSASRAWHARRPLSPWLSGAALLYTLVSALAYHLLLAHTTPPFSMTGTPTPPERWHLQWAALQLLHTVAPAAALLDWLCLTPADRLHLRQATSWLLYPLAYLAFYLARPLVHPSAYLYPFLDPPAHGYRATLANALLLGLAIYALAVLLIALDHTRPTPVRRRI